MLTCVFGVAICQRLVAIEKLAFFLRSDFPWHHRPVRDSTRLTMLVVLQPCGREAQVQVGMDICMTVTTLRRLGTSAGGRRAVRATWPAGLTNSGASRQTSGGKSGALGGRRTVRALRQADSRTLGGRSATVSLEECQSHAAATRESHQENSSQRHHVLDGETC